MSALAARHREALYRYVSRFTGDADLAEDVVQETLQRLAERPPPDPSSVRGWLFRVATNLARDALKLASRRSQLLRERADQVPLPASPPNPGHQVEQSELRARVRTALDTLSERERTVLLMYHEGFRHREIAEAVNTTIPSVGTMIVRATDKVARALGRAGME